MRSMPLLKKWQNKRLVLRRSRSTYLFLNPVDCLSDDVNISRIGLQNCLRFFWGKWTSGASNSEIDIEIVFRNSWR